MAEFSKPAQLLLNERPVLKCEEANASVKSGDSPVYTLEDGLAGFSDGAHEMEITLKQAIPQDGLQIDWIGLAVSHQTVRPKYVVGGRYYSCEGRVTSAAPSSKVNTANMVDVTLMCRVVAFGNAT